jgi:hypothetical protein
VAHLLLLNTVWSLVGVAALGQALRLDVLLAAVLGVCFKLLVFLLLLVLL